MPERAEQIVHEVPAAALAAHLTDDHNVMDLPAFVDDAFALHDSLHRGAGACECDRHPLGARLNDWTCPVHGSFPGSFSADDVDSEQMGNTAALLLAEVIDHDDENGALANATADDLRDALRLAADRLRCAIDGVPAGPIYVGARRLVAEVWWLVQAKIIDSRSRAADAALDLRDSIDPSWWPER